jgi:hypothetical protein
MKNIIFVLLLSSSFSYVIFSQPSSFMIITSGKLCFSEGDTVCYYLGMNSTEFVQRFGQPEDKADPKWTGGYLSGCSFLHYTTDGLAVAVDSTGRIKGFTFYVVPSEKYKAANVYIDIGLYPGASARSIQKVLGHPFKQKKVNIGDLDWLDLYYKYDDMVLSFHFNRGSLTSIGLHAGYISYLEEMK